MSNMASVSNRNIFAPHSEDELQELVIEAAAKNQKIMLKEDLLLASLAPGEDTIIIDLANLDQLFELDQDNCTVIVGGGVNFLALQQELIQKGLFFPADTFASHATSLAYNVMHNLPSFYLAKYGNYRRNIVGMDAILLNGSKIKLGGKNIKHVSGYDLMGLLIGSKEALGIITKLVLRLLPAPEATRVIITPFDNLKDAALAAALATMKGSIPAKLTVINQKFAFAVEGLPLPVKAMLVAEFDGFNASLPVQVQTYKKIIEDAAEADLKNNWIETHAPAGHHRGDENPPHPNHLPQRGEGICQVELTEPWEIRKLWHEVRSAAVSVYSKAPDKFSLSVPISKLPVLGEKLDCKAKANGKQDAVMIHAAAGTGVVVPSDGGNLRHDSRMEQLKMLLAQCDGQLLNAQSFDSPGMQLIHQRLRQIFNPYNITRGRPEGGI